FASSARLATQITSSRQWFGLFGGKYNPMIADLDVVKLEDYYKSFGYLSVKIARELQWDDEHRNVTLVFHIQEGPQYKVKDVLVSGASALPKEQLEALPKLHKGEVYSKQKVDADISAIKDFYGMTGRNPTVHEELFYPESGVCLVRYDVMERPPARVGQIIIVGNEHTRENVIRRQIPLYPGQILTYPDLRVAERNLTRLNIFEANPETGVRPMVTVLNPEDDNEFKDIFVQVQEAKTGSLLFGVGVNSDAGLTGSIVLNERNFDITRFPTSFDDFLSGRAFRGGGQELRLEAVPGTVTQRYSATLREPFLFNSDYSLSVGAYSY